MGRLLVDDEERRRLHEGAVALARPDAATAIARAVLAEVAAARARG